jgi:cation:H+ antiporter
MIGLIIFWIGIFILSLYILIRASEHFTKAAESIGRSFGIPDFIVGVTIVAVGTSLPEMISSVFAVVQESSEIVIGNVVGSNVTNIFLIVGFTAITARQLKIAYELIHIDLPLLMGSALFLAIAVWDGKFTVFEAVLCLCGVVVYFLHAVMSRQKQKKQNIPAETKQLKARIKLKPKDIIVILVSALFIYLGGRYTIEAVIRLSSILTIGKEVIAASAVALGTSLPELVVCITAARQGRPEIAIGNVLGSNIFNALAVMGIPALIGTIHIPENILFFGLPIMVIASLLFFFMTQDKEITQWEGWLLIVFYIFFVGGLFGLN